MSSSSFPPANIADFIRERRVPLASEDDDEQTLLCAILRHYGQEDLEMEVAPGEFRGPPPSNVDDFWYCLALLKLLNNARRRERLARIGTDDEMEERIHTLRTSRNCFYCNFPPPNGVDRVDNGIAYYADIDNLVPCCFNCNTMKGQMTVGEFLDQCCTIGERTTLQRSPQSVE